MAGSLFPAFFRIQYQSAYSAHTMTIPMRTWSPDAVPTHKGYFLSWNGALVGADGMIDGFKDLLLPFFLATTSFENYQIFTMASPTAQAVPVRGDVFAVQAGTNVSTSWAKAVEQIYTFRTTVASLAKLYFLDIPTNNNFDRNTTVTPASALEALIAYYTDPDNAFSARVDGRPDVYLQATANINEKLRKAYRMT